METVLARIEAAAGRVEAAAQQRGASDAALQQKYDDLRKEARTALTDLDALINKIAS